MHWFSLARPGAVGCVRMLSDALAGDRTLFAREDYVEEAWRIVDPVFKAEPCSVHVRARQLGARGDGARRAARGVGGIQGA
jgi:glucose-6-phosphate 1-dehydrogenase